MLHAAIEEAHELSDRVLEATAGIQELELRYTIDPERVAGEAGSGWRNSSPSSRPSRRTTAWPAPGG